MFADIIKSLRKSNKMTQAELAKKLNSSTSKIGMWEIGKNEPTIEDLKSLSDIFGVSVDYLVGKTELTSNNELNLDLSKIKLRDNINPKMAIEDESFLDDIVYCISVDNNYNVNIFGIDDKVFLDFIKYSDSDIKREFFIKVHNIDGKTALDVKGMTIDDIKKLSSFLEDKYK